MATLAVDEDMREILSVVRPETQQISLQPIAVYVEGILIRAREESKRARTMEGQAFEEFNAYLFAYRKEGAMVAGDWVRLVNNRRQYNQADKKELDRLAAVRRAEEEEREAWEAIFRFQKESGEKAAAVQQKLTLASRRRAEFAEPPSISAPQMN